MMDFLPSVTNFFTEVVDMVKTLAFIDFFKETVMSFPLMEWFWIIFVVAIGVGVTKLIVELL